MAKKHSRTNVVTVSIDRMAFKQPAYMGELLTFKASLNMVGTSSMEIGVRVEAEDLRTGEVRHTNSAYLTYVALGEDGRPTPVPPLKLETETAKRRHREAELRRELRKKELELEEGRRGRGLPGRRIAELFSVLFQGRSQATPSTLFSRRSDPM